MPRRARHLIPTELPRRGEVIAACTTLALLAHVLFAQLTLVLAVTFAAVSRASRWRRWWLVVPASVGMAWTLAVGPRAAAAGFAAGPAQILAYLGGGGHPLSHLGQPFGAFSGAGSWLPPQFPLALIVGAAEAALAGWLDWVHTDEWAVPSPRPGVLAAVRSVANRRAIRAGAMVTRDGCVLGVAPATGARVVLRWPETAGGVLVTGAAAEIVAITSFQVVHAALRRRKPVIAVDMTGDTAASRAMAEVCAATGTPLRVFGTAEGCYEPLRQSGPERRLAMTLALLGAGDPADRPADGVRTYLHGVFELMDAVPADQRTPILDDVVHLLNPLAMQARFGLAPAIGPRSAEVAAAVRAAVAAAQADPQTVLTVARRLGAVRRSPAGRWLCPGDGGPDGADGGIDLAAAVRERSAVLFRVDAADLVRLICTDIAALGADLRRIGVDGDGLVWLHGLHPAAVGQVAGLVADGAASGLAVLVSATSPPGEDMAGLVGTVLVHKPGDGAAAASLAGRTGTRMVPAFGTSQTELVASPAVPAQALLSLAPAQFVLTVNSPSYRLVQLGQLVPARLPGGRKEEP